MLRLARRFSSNKSGATAIEYGLLGALIAVAAITGFQSVGDGLTSLFDTVTQSVEAGIQSGTTEG